MGKKLSTLCCKSQESLPVLPSDAEDHALSDGLPTSPVDLSSTSGQYPQEISENPSCIKQVTQYDFSPAIFQSKQLKDYEDYLNYPILQDKETIEYIQKSKVSLVM